MKKIDIKELKEIQIGILDVVDEFCKKNDIKYFLCAGTLIGAIRHKGYIPWDDDIDIGMLRDDYDKFLKLFNSHNDRFKAYSIENNDHFLFPFCKVMDTSTILNEPNNADNSLSVNIDVFAFDNAPDDYSKVKKLYWVRDFYRKCHMLRTRYTYRKSFIQKIIITFLSIFLLPFPKNFFIKKIAKLSKKYQNEKCEYVTCFLGYDKLYLKRNCFTDYINVDFENKKYKAPKKYDEVLRAHYGNYLELPPEEQRVSHHTFHAYYKD